MSSLGDSCLDDPLGGPSAGSVPASKRPVTKNTQTTMKQIPDRVPAKRTEPDRLPGNLIPKIPTPLQQLGESNIIGITFSRKDGQIVDANDEFLRIVGYSREDLEAGRMNWGQMTPPGCAEVDGLCANGMADSGRTGAFEREFMRKDGAHVPVLIGMVTLHGRALDALAFVVDMTERKHAEQERDLLMTERVAMLDCVGDGIYGLDLSSRCTFMNRAAARMLGFEPEECLGKNMHGLIHSRRADGSPYPAEDCRIASAFQEDSYIHFDDEVLWRKDGTPFEVEYSSYPIIVNGHVQGRVVSFKDITARKRAEMDLRRSEQRYRNIVENTHEGICTCDAGGTIIYCNQRLLNLLGYEEANPQLDCREIHFGDDGPELEQRFDRRRRGISESYDKRLRRKDDTAVWVSSSASPVYNDRGDFTGSLCMFSDVTERKRLEEQLLQSQKMQAIGQLAGGIAHDFNNLLTVILGYSAVLERKLAADPLVKNVVEVRKAGERAAQLTQQLLAFSRKQVLHPRVISVKQLILDTEILLRRLIGEHIELSVVLDPEVGNIKADPGQMEQVLMNLSINARDAMAKGGKLLVETRRREFERSAAALRSLEAGVYVELTVTDTGCGIDESIKDRIFEPFFTTKDPGIGTGLGLSTVQGIVNQSGGSIAVYSEIDVGTTFRIYLPLVDEAVAGCESRRLTAARPAGETILVVEDDPGIRTLAVELLREHGYQVLEASGAEQAIAACELNPVHLLLTDVVMAGMNGHELAGVLMTSRPALKVLYMSGYTEKGIVQQGIVDPCLNFLQKPFRPEELLWKIGDVLAKRPGPPRVLIVDDDEQIRSFLATLLEVEGYTVAQAANGKQALEQCRGGDLDLVVTDLVMPEQEGLETIHTIRRHWPRLPVIAISGAFGGAYLDLAKKLGAGAIIRKPFQPDIVLAEVRRLTTPTVS